MSEEPVNLFAITITRTIQPSGQQGFILSTPENFSFIEVLGMLEGAKWKLFEQMTNTWGDTR